MPQMLSAVPNLKLSRQKDRDLTSHQAAQLRGFKLADFAGDERISFFPNINFRLPLGKFFMAFAALVLGLLLLGHFAQIGSRLSSFFGSFIYDPGNAAISGDPVITGMVDWLPILLVGLSTVILTGLVINRARYGRSLQQAGPRLVTRQPMAAKPSSARPGPLAVKTGPATQENAHLFLVPRTPESRHLAQEQVRLERDARADAIARAAAAERLIVSGSVRVHQSEALVIPAPRRTLATMPPQSAPPRPHSGVFFPAAAVPAGKPSPINAPRPHLSRAPHTPAAIL